MTTHNTNIDESLYSRQLYAIGKETMQSLITSKVLIINLDPLAIEICKNIILMGVGTITLADGDTIISYKDYGTNYYINENDIGKKRSDIIGKRIGELNTNCIINKYSGKINENIISKYDLVVFIDCKFNEYYFKLNEFCRTKNIKTIFTSSHGFYGYIFCDFYNYITNDNDGEKIKAGLILSCNDKICCTDKNHDFSIGNKFKMNNSLDNNIYEIIKIINTREFIINQNIETLGEYSEIKNIFEIKFKSLRDSITSPEFIITDFSDFEMPSKLHDINVKILSEQKDILNLDDPLVKKILDAYDGQLVPVNSIIGGLVAHNIISGLSNKYTPINQWLYYECLKICTPKKASDYKYSPIYINQVKVIGSELQEKINKTRIFIVGSGAIGCEHLKNFSMMGIREQTITDMDVIEKSNLSRQFLFRNSDIGKYKSEIASLKSKKMNKHVNINYKLNRVGTETEHIFNQTFYSNIDIIVNALDNVNARLYMDNQAIIYDKPLLESGTLGLKGNTQVIIPHITESYGSTTDTTEEQIPVCTLKNFPYEISHCIQWAREQFESLFVLPYQTYNKLKKYNKDDKLHEKIDKMILNELYEIQQNLNIIKNKNIQIFMDFFSINYRQKIHDLIVKYPENHITENGEKFWSGTKKFPRVLYFDETDEICMNLFDSFNKILISIGYNKINIYDILDKINNELNKNKSLDVKIATNADEEKQNKESELATLDSDKLKNDIIDFIKNTDYNFNEIEFEKDDDNNGHIKFITACSNLRAQSYNITTASEFETKGIAGKIIPALATTTSIVSGLIAIEMYKLINDNVYNIENFKNTFIGLGICFIGSSEPVPCKKISVGKLNISLWTKLKFNDMSIKQLIANFKNIYDVDVDQIMSDNISIYSNYMNQNKKNDILDKNIKTLIDKHDNIILNISISDNNDNSEIILVEII